MSQKSAMFSKTKLTEDVQMGPESGDAGITRSSLVESLGIDTPSGDLFQDLGSNKKVLLERGISIKRAAPAPDMGEGIVQFVASTEGVKRDGNRVRNDGWSFENFAKNPQFLWCHDYSSLPIGKHVDWRVEKVDGEPVLRLWSKFCSADLYPFADKVRRMYEEGFLQAGSIGWIPTKYESILDENGYTVGFDFLENDLLEFSAVPVPSDPNALIEAVQRGVLSSDDMENLVKFRKSPEERDLSYSLSNQDFGVEEAPKREAVIGTAESADSEMTKVEEETVSVDEPVDAGGELDMAEVRTEDSEAAEVETAEVAEVETAEAEEVETAEVAEVETAEAEDSSEGVEEVAEERDAEEAADLESQNERGGMGEDDYDEDHHGGGGVKDKLVEVLQEASKDFTTKIVAAVMEVVGDEEGTRSEEDFCVENNCAADAECCDGEEREATEASELVDQLIESTEVFASAVENETETRIGAKVSQRNKDRLSGCRDKLQDVVNDITELMEDRKETDESMDVDSDSGIMEVKVPENDDTTFAVSEDTAEQRIDWGRAVDIASKIQRTLSNEEVAEEPAEEPKVEIDSVASKAQEILRSLEKKNKSEEKKSEIKSDYLKELVRRVKSNKE